MVGMTESKGSKTVDKGNAKLFFVGIKHANGDAEIL
jgi:hypothetical protein